MEFRQETVGTLEPAASVAPETPKSRTPKDFRMDPQTLLKQWHMGVRIYSIAHIRAAAGCEKNGRWLGILVVVCTSVIAASFLFGLTDSPNSPVRTVVALLSLATAVLAGLHTFLKQPETAEKHRAAAVNYDQARRELEQVWAFPPEAEVFRQFVETFLERWVSLDRQSPTLAPRFYDSAAKMLREGAEDEWEVPAPPAAGETP
jgi:hypothetical protein